MTLGDLKAIIDCTLKDDPWAEHCTVTVPVSGVCGIGATPSVEIRSAGKGIDWDNWQFMLDTEVPIYKNQQK